MNPTWRTLRPWVAGALVLLAIVFLRLLFPYLTPLALAFLLTYFLIPVVNTVENQTGWPRGIATTVVYLLLILLIAIVPARLTPLLVDQVVGLGPTLERAARESNEWLAHLGTITLFGQTFDPAALYLQFSDTLINQLVSLGGRLATSSLGIVAGFATTFLTTLVWILFILVMSFYIVVDWPNITHYLWSLTPQSARPELYYLVRRVSRTWNAFLRGQLLLSTVIFVATTVALWILGMPQAFSMGVIAGICNLIPNVGPFLSAVPALALALAQGSTRFDVSPFVFALMVAGAYTVIQQLESNLLVPRIIGGSVKIHPAMVLLGALIGVSQAGVLGILLVAPTLGALRIIVGYAYRKLLDPDYVASDGTVPSYIADIPDPRERRPAPLNPSSSERWERVKGWFRRSTSTDK